MEPGRDPSPSTEDPARVPAGSGRRRRWPRVLARSRLFIRRTIYLLGPIALTGALLWLVGILLSSQVAYELLVISVASLVWFGNTVIISPAVFGETITLGTWDVALWIMYMSVFAAFFYTWNLDLLERVPFIGPFLKRARKNAAAVLAEQKWIRRLAAFGVAFFVVTPLPGSGQLGGCFVGRILGLTRRMTFLVVSLAGVVVCVFYALAGSWVQGILDDAQVGIWFRIGGAVVVLLICWFMGQLLWKLGRKRPEGEAPPPPKPGDVTIGLALLVAGVAAVITTAVWLVFGSRLAEAIGAGGAWFHITGIVLSFAVLWILGVSGLKLSRAPSHDDRRGPRRWGAAHKSSESASESACESASEVEIEIDS